MFSNGQSIKLKNHTKAGATKKMKVTRRRLALRLPYSMLEKSLFLIGID